VGFETVREYTSHIEVTAYELRPNGANCIVTASVTHPIALALIPRTSSRFNSTLRERTSHAEDSGQALATDARKPSRG
jgi:hypothetical protein